MRISATVKLNTQGITSEVIAKIKKVQAPFDSLVMQDSNFFCPIKTGKLKDSAITNTTLGNGEIIWSTPYARKQYYDYRKPSYQPNPNATAKWFESAKARWLTKWRDFIDECIKRS